MVPKSMESSACLQIYDFEIPPDGPVRLSTRFREQTARVLSAMTF